MSQAAGVLSVTHVISTLQVGGAEMAMLKLLSLTPSEEFQCSVVALGSDGPIGDEIRSLGIPVRALNIRPERADPRAAVKLLGALRARRPQVVQTWMYHADLLGGLAGRVLGARVCWDIQSGTLEPDDVCARTLRIQKACARLSRFLPDAVVCCSEAGRDIHVGVGYDARRMHVIPNGFDTERLRPDRAARAAVRRELGIADDEVVIGMAARYHAQKDFPNFARAAGLLARDFPRVTFVLCGAGVTPDNDALQALLEQHGVRERTHMLGLRRDVERVNNAFDIATLSSSWGEAFPNVLGEAMACGVPCVATNLGDARLIIGSTGRIGEPRDAQALGAAWAERVRQTEGARRQLGAAARARVCREFGLDRVAARFHELHRSLTTRAGITRIRAGSQGVAA